MTMVRQLLNRARRRTGGVYTAASIVVATLALLLSIDPGISSAAPKPPKPPRTPPASVVAQPTTIARNGTFTSVAVTGCPAGSSVTILVPRVSRDAEILAVGTADQLGARTFTDVAMADNLPPGTYELTATCGALSAKQSIKVTAAPGPTLTAVGLYGPSPLLNLRPNRVERGAYLTYAAGQGCAAGSTVAIKIVTARNTYFDVGGTAIALADGSFWFDQPDQLFNPVPTGLVPGVYVAFAECGGQMIDGTVNVA